MFSKNVPMFSKEMFQWENAFFVRRNTYVAVLTNCLEENLIDETS
jgi:hypothetical protein